MTPIQGSERQMAPRSRITGRAASEERVQVSVRLRTRGKQLCPGARLSRAAFADNHSACPGDAAAVTTYLAGHGLTVTEVDLDRRMIAAEGTVAQMEATFGTELHAAENAEGAFRARMGPVRVKDEAAAERIEAVLGLDSRPCARPYFRTSAPAIIAHAGAKGFLPRRLAQAYNYPLDATGAGQAVAIISLGGTYYPQDLVAAAQAAGVPTASVKVITIDHAQLKPSDADGENALDVQEVATVAPGATIYLLVAPNTDAGFLDAITYAIHTLKVNVISISWGGPEAYWTAQAMNAFTQEFSAAAALGISVFAASGDDGSSDGLPGTNTDFPASSPFATACGGTRTSQAVQSGPLVEVAWGGVSGNGASGGGYSKAFPAPSYQVGTAAAVKGGRGVPDIAGNGDPQTGDIIWVKGQQQVIGGTSAVSPRMAGLVALMNQKLGRPVGFMNPLFYSAPSASIDITVGTNGAFVSSQGWDPVTGMGRPDGAKLLAAVAPTVPVPPVVPTPPPPIQPPPAPPAAGKLVDLIAADLSPTGMAKLKAAGVDRFSLSI